MNSPLRIAIGCDHAGYLLKEAIKKHLDEKGLVVTDHGTNSEASVDYPDYVHPAANQVEKGDADFGVLICGSGEGVCMAANKHQGIRAALVWNNEVAAITRQHNNANMICLPARFLKPEEAIIMVDTFLSTAFEGGRHERRVNKIPLPTSN